MLFAKGGMGFVLDGFKDLLVEVIAHIKDGLGGRQGGNLFHKLVSVESLSLGLI